MKYVFVVNGRMNEEKRVFLISNIKRVCDEEGKEYLIHTTSRPKEATEIAKTYQGDNCVLYAVGGDGTLHEIVNGTIGSTNRIGVIPAGSGNDFYRMLKKCNEKTIIADVGKINEEYFINTVCIGIDADVGNNIERLRNTWIPRSQLYNVSLIYTLFQFKKKKLLLTIEERKMKAEFTIATICNGQYYGGGFWIAPKAKIDDEEFEFYYVEGLPKWKLPKLALKLKRGLHETSYYVKKIPIKNIRIQANEPIACNVDGEMIMNQEFYIQMSQEKVTIQNDLIFVQKILGGKG